jgi:phosphatidylcholine synthase
MTTETTSSNLFFRKAAAYGVHFFTATGAVWGLLALRAIFVHEWKAAIAWMVLAMFVDGFDGMLARWADTKKYAANIDGALMDNIIDYLNYVVVPALMLIEAPHMLPAGWELPGAAAILLTSAYQFSQSDAKTDETHEYFFKGFPSYWNVAAIYFLVMRFNPWINLALLALFNVLVFVPIKYIYPTRSQFAKRLTLILSYLFGIVGVWGVMQYPHVPAWVLWVSYAYAAYYIVLSLWPKNKRQITEAV